MRAPRFGRLHSLPPWLPLLLIPVLLWSRPVRASSDFATPTPGMIDQLRRQHSAEDWLRVTVETTRLELATTSAEIVATPPPPPAEAWVPKVRARIKPGQLLRLTGDFGRFSGRAANIGDQGLSGLQQDPAFDSTLPPPSEPLAWTEIDRIDRWGGRSRQFAKNTGLVTGLALGLLAPLFAAAGASMSGSPATAGQLAGAAAGGFVVGGAAGASLGALIGVVTPGWNLLHRRSKP